LANFSDAVIIKRYGVSFDFLALKVVYEECEGKLGAFPIGALHGDIPTKFLHDHLGNSQTQTHSPSVTVLGP
jgi:hypothetical protein